jgi:hypothetical protein
MTINNEQREYFLKTVKRNTSYLFLKKNFSSGLGAKMSEEKHERLCLMFLTFSTIRKNIRRAEGVFV